MRRPNYSYPPHGDIPRIPLELLAVTPRRVNAVLWIAIAGAVVMLIAQAVTW